MTAVKRLLRKSLLVSLLNKTSEARALCGHRLHKGERLFCFLASDAIMIVGLTLVFETGAELIMVLRCSNPAISCLAMHLEGREYWCGRVSLAGGGVGGTR